MRPRHGFTLVELSIALIIIGLVVGGIFVGRDLIKAATIRANLSQIERIKLATTTFKLRYQQLPGDMSPTRRNSYCSTLLPALTRAGWAWATTTAVSRPTGRHAARPTRKHRSRDPAVRCWSTGPTCRTPN